MVHFLTNLYFSGFFRFLQRGNENSPQKHGNNDDYEIAPRLPPPYNAPHRPIPPAVPPHGSQAYRFPRTAPGPISHHRIHSAQESTSVRIIFANLHIFFFEIL